MTGPRLSYEESCRELQKQHLLDPGEMPPLPHRPPRYDDETLGVSFFRTMLAEAKLEKLTLPWTFFGRSEIRATSLKDTDLSGSVANWNDFIDVDFSAASLSSADLRYCGFKECDFTDADLTDTKLTRKAGAALDLSAEQRCVVDWQADDGEEPAGG
jgi:hypothetical protein